MIELNLLPDELKIKKRKTLDLTTIPIIPSFLGVLFFLIGTHLSLISLANLNNSMLNKLNSQWENYAPKRKEIDTLKKEVKDINTKVKAIEELTGRRILWARKLNSLSESVPANIWLSDLYYDKKSPEHALVLEGFAAGTEEDVGKFMDLLENNNIFFVDLQNIKLGFTKTGLIEKKEVTSFKLICAFKQEKKD